MDIFLRAQDSIDGKLLSKIITALSATSSCHFEVSSSITNLDHAYIPARKQFDADQILKWLLKENQGEKVIGLVDIDLCTPILTFVFGQAQLDGNAAVVSIYRLKNEYYRLTSDQEQLVLRIKKEIIHELGHLLGLYHCQNRGCVMNFSGSIINIDFKDDRFCPACSVYLGEKSEHA